MEHKDKWYKAVGHNQNSVMVNLAGKKFLYTCDVNLIQQITSKHASKLGIFREVDAAWKIVMPKSLLLAKGEDWKRIRFIYSKAISKLEEDNFAPEVAKICDLSVADQLKEDTQIVNLVDFLGRISFDSFNKIAFGRTYEEVGSNTNDILQDCLYWLEVLADRMITPVSLQFIRYFKIQEHFRTKAALARLRKNIGLFIKLEEERFKCRIEDQTVNLKEATASNLLEAFLLACFEDEGHSFGKQSHQTSKKRTMSKIELRDQLMLTLFAGFETSMSTIGLCLAWLAKYPEAQERLYEEVKSIDWHQVTSQQLNDLQFLMNCINETNRLGGVFTDLARRVLSDIEVEGYLIPKEAHVMFDLDRLGKRKDLWNTSETSNLATFDPDRWQKERPPPGVFQPFGIGPRACIGKKIAMYQVKAIVGYLISHYTITETEQQVRLGFAIGRSVNRDSCLRFTKR